MNAPKFGGMVLVALITSFLGGIAVAVVSKDGGVGSLTMLFLFSLLYFAVHWLDTLCGAIREKDKPA